MIDFKVNKILRQVIGLKSIGEFKYRKYVVIAVPIIISMQFICLILMSILNFVYNFNDNIYKSLLSWQPILGFYVIAMQYWHLLVNRKHFYSMFDDMHATVDESLIKFSTLVFTTVIPSLPTFGIVAFHLCIGKYSVDSWHLFYPIWMPFELNSLSYAFAAVLHTCCNAFGSIVFFTINSMFIEFSLYNKALILDIKSAFDRVDQLAKSRKPDEKLMLQCCKYAVDLHERVYRFLERFSNLANFIILVTVVPAMLIICVSLLIIQKHSQAASSFELLAPYFAVFFASQIIFIFYYFGQKLHSDLLDLSDMIYHSEWYRYPRSVRRFVLLMMMRAQRPFYLSTYGLMKCTLEKYVGVVHRIFSTYMLLRASD